MDFLTLRLFIPEIFLSFSFLFLLVLNGVVVTTAKTNFPLIEKEVYFQSIFSLFIFGLLVWNLEMQGIFFNSMLVVDSSVQYLKLLTIILSIFILGPILENFELNKLNLSEYFILFLISVFSCCFLISTCDLLLGYLILEIQALSFYILSGFKRNSAYSTESGLRYFIFGSFISGIFLFGSSLIYGLLGTSNFLNISMLLSLENKINSFEFYVILLVAVFFLVFTFLFKLIIFPFHFWAPDVYDGAPLSSTILFSLLPKIALFSFLIKTFNTFSDTFIELSYILSFSGICSILVGAVFAFKQKRMKRFLIYSSISQLGFLVIALSLNTVDCVVSIYFFLIIYLITSFVSWSILVLLVKFKNTPYFLELRPVFLSDLSNLYKFNKFLILSLVLIFFSIAGIPPLSGFWSKFLIIFSIVNSNKISISLFVILVSALSIFYYLRVIKIGIFEASIKYYDSPLPIFFKNQDFISCFLISIMLYSLVYLFFYPTIPLLLANILTFDILF